MVMIKNKVPEIIDTVLNPQGETLPEIKDDSSIIPTGVADRRYDSSKPTLTPAPRLDTLDGKTLYLVDGRFGGSYEFLTQMQNWFNKNMPGVKTVVKRKPSVMFMDEPELWAEIKAKGDAMIMGVGG
jgi:hypothetical protein